jgi:hypothetical protein
MDDFQIEVERLINLLLSASTDLNIHEEHEKEYTKLRVSLLNKDRFMRFAPRHVKTCGTLREFKREMQAKGGYQERRKYIKEMFSPYYGEDNLVEAIGKIMGSGPNRITLFCP